MSWTDLEHTIWKNLKDAGLDQKPSYFLAISGGMDSMALLHLMLRLKPQSQLKVAYYNHGITADLKQNEFRIQCLDLIKNFCDSNENIEFVTEESRVSLSSEAEMRSARWAFLNKHKINNEPVITAHHLDDWTETLTLKLIRGVGPEGFTAFKIWDGQIFRPFLQTSKKELSQYVNQQKITWLEDPSNESDLYLRNWLRNTWFKSLDDKNPSGYLNFSRSLLRLCQELDQNQPFELQFFRNSPELGLDRQWYISLTDKLQLKALSLFIRHHSILDVTAGHLAEIQKRLDKNQKDITFTLAHVNWVINETQIVLIL